jgi:AcrR family transcriptional regulator
VSLGLDVRGKVPDWSMMAKMEAVDAPADGRRRPGRPTLSNEQLLDTALNLFLEHGFERTTFEGICAVAGMAKRTVYARYPDKPALFRAALTRAIEDWLVPVEQLSACESDDLHATLLRIAQLLLRNILRPEGIRLLRLTNAVSGRMPEIAAYNTKMGTEPTLAYLADLFRRKLLSPTAHDQEADEAALAFLHLVVGGPASTAAWGVVLDEEAVESHTRYCVKLFLHGALPRDREPIKALASTLNEGLDKLHEARRLLEKAESLIADGPNSA